MQYVDDVLFQKSPKGSLVDLTRIIEFIQEWDDRRTNSIEALQKVKNYLLDKGYMGGDNHGWGGKKPIDAIRDSVQKAYQDRNKPTGLPDSTLDPGFKHLDLADRERLTREFGLKVLEPGNHMCAVCTKPVELRGEKWMHKVPIHGEIVLHDATPRLYDIREEDR